jgi:hypothetical protein
MIRTRDHHSYCRTLVGAGSSMAVAVSESSFDRDAQVATQSPSDLRVMAGAGLITPERRALAPSALKLLVAERSS